MRVKDFASIAGEHTTLKIVKPGKAEIMAVIASQFWDTLDRSILDLEVRSITVSKENRTVIIETVTGRPWPVRTFEELKGAMNDPAVKDIKLFADICSEENYAVFLEGEGIAKSLDLNGHTLSLNDPEEKTNDDAVVVFVTLGAQLDIFDSSPDRMTGSVRAARDNGEESINIAVEASGGGVVNIHGGNFYAENSPGAEQSETILADGAFINIFGGIFENGSYTDAEGSAQVLLCYPEEIGGKIACRGGFYEGQNPEDYAAEGYETWSLLTHEEDELDDYYTVLPHQSF